MEYLIKEQNYAIRKLESSEYDFALLSKWRSDERVSPYFGGRDKDNSPEAIRKKYLPRIEGKTRITPCIAEIDEKPSAYIQYYTFTEEMYKTHRLSDFQNAFGIDIFLFPDAGMGKGIGRNILRLMCYYLFNEKNADIVEICPRKVNARAVRAYLGAGFRFHSELEKGEFFEGKWFEEYVMIMTAPVEKESIFI